MSDALSRYRMATKEDWNALDRYKEPAPADTLGALARYLGLPQYWDRQGRMAQQGLQMAEEGAQAVRGGDMSGLAGVLLGPAQYLGSPVSALFPERSEVEAATDVPAWSKPLIAGGLEAMAVMAPGPGGKAKGLGKGLTEIADEAVTPTRAFGGMASMGGEAAPVVKMTVEQIEAEGRKLARGFNSPEQVDNYIAALGVDDPRIQKMLPALERAKQLLAGKADLKLNAQEAAAERAALEQAARDQRIMDRDSNPAAKASPEDVERMRAQMKRWRDAQ